MQIKPKTLVKDGKVWLFVATSYEQMTREQTAQLIVDLQLAEAILRAGESKAQATAVGAI